MADQSAPSVRSTVREGVAVVELNRPERRNVLDAEMVTALGETFDRIEGDGQARAVVLTGAGTSFCAGAVLDTLLRASEGSFDEVRGVYEGFLRVLHSPLPTIAAVNGPAVGAGLNLALACDVRIASTSAVFESRFPQLRLHPGGGHTWLLDRAVGRQQATAMALFGRVLDAGDALAAGLALEVHDASRVVGAAVELASGIADMELELVHHIAATLREAEQEPRHQGILGLETTRQRWSTTRPDFVAHTAALRDRISGAKRSGRLERDRTDS